MDNLVFNISERCENGKKVRMNGQIPCIIYGRDLNKALSAKITKRELIRLLGYPKSSVVSLNLNGDYKKCIVKEMQKDPFGKIIHIDFQSISKGELVKLKIPVIFYGQEALEAKGLLLESFVNEVELQGEVGKFPDNISIDVSKLEHGDSILLKDLHISDKLKADIDEDKVIATVGELISKEQEEMIEEEIESSTEE